MEKTAAIVLAAGQGKRMRADRPKQYLLIKDKPVLYYSLLAFENSKVDEIILVTGKGEEAYCQRKIVEKYGFQKISKIVSGGQERYDSVFAGLQALDSEKMQEKGYVFIHDGARPFLTPQLIHRLFEETKIHKACVAGVPVKDTIKVADKNRQVVSTPERELLWQVQTPQVFSYGLIYEAYEKLFEKLEIQVTDDAMVLEKITGHPVHLVEGYYQNIKITTPEDLAVAQVFLEYFEGEKL
jgi:2-C-methyl-D-erythritol 4-phosphate cytidylyltransferase